MNNNIGDGQQNKGVDSKVKEYGATHKKQSQSNQDGAMLKKKEMAGKMVDKNGRNSKVAG